MADVDKATVIDTITDRNLWKKAFKRILQKKTLTEDEKLVLQVAYEGTYIDETIASIKAGTFEFQTPTKIQIQKIGSSKLRTVYIYPLLDRIVLNVLYQASAIVYGSYINDKVYSYKAHINTSYAVNDLIKHYDLRDKYAVKLDISSYFNSVSKEAILNKLNEIYKSEPTILNILIKLHTKDRVIFKGEEIEEFCSLTPGSPFSSFMANVMLKEIDDHISNDLGVIYARYSDDIIMFSDSLEELHQNIEFIKEKLNVIGLDINEKKYVYYDKFEPVTFLGLTFAYNKETNRFDVEVSDITYKKIKHHIKSICKAGRKKVEMEKKNPRKEVAKAISKLNSYFYMTFTKDMELYGYCHYLFSNINTPKGLKELDYYLKDTLRYIMSGKHNKYNTKRISTEELQELGLQSFVQNYYLFKTDKDYFYEQMSKIKPVYLDQLGSK